MTFSHGSITNCQKYSVACQVSMSIPKETLSKLFLKLQHQMNSFSLKFIRDGWTLLNATDSLGTIAPGKLADLVLLDGNPLQDISNTRRIAAVLANGRLFRRQDLGELLAKAREAASHARKGS